MNALVTPLCSDPDEVACVELDISSLPLSGHLRSVGHLPISLAPTPRFNRNRVPVLTRTTSFRYFVDLMQIYCDDGSPE